MQLDVNLLIALDALLEEGSVTGAAERLNLSSPAVSRTLGRLRRATGDQILVRSGRGMTPTPRAVAMRAQVHLLVQQAQDLLSPVRAVDLSTVVRTFTLRWHDAIINAAGGPLLAAVRGKAPNVRLRFIAEPAADTEDLRRGQVDLEAGGSEPTQPDISYERIAEDRLVVVMRPGHPLADEATPFGPAEYLSAAHVTVSRRGRLRDAVDGVLGEDTARRDVVASAPTAVAALHLVRDNDVLAVVAQRASQDLLARFDLRTRPFPYAVPPVGLYISWHRRYDDDPAHQWLRRELTTIVAQLYGPESLPVRLAT